MSGKTVLLISASSVTRALLSSLLGSNGDHVVATDALPRAIQEVAAVKPEVVVVEAAILRASPDALDRLRAASTAPLGVVLVDRTYSDERRGAEEARAFGAGAFAAVPTSGASLFAAIGAAIGDSINVSAAAPALDARAASSVPPADAEAEQRGRYVERLWSRLATLDAYQLLRVSPSATDLEIKAAFRERALEFHPDRQLAVLDEDARERVYQIFKKVSWAFRRIGDPSARKEYDAQRRAT